MNLLKAIPSIIFNLSIATQSVIGQVPHAVSSGSGGGWTSNAFEHFVFVENKGQFDARLSEHEMGRQGKNGDEKSKIQYYADSKGVDVYFTANGLTYRHDEFISLVSEKEREKMERDGKGKEQKAVEVKHHYLQVEWVGANSSSFIEANDPQSFYYTYPSEKDNGRTTLKAGCFKKITYKNLYSNIDVEYILPEKGGVKYSLILHPGADLSKVKMRYNGAKELRTDEEGNVIIGTTFGDFVDHSPISFYQNGAGIGSAFELKGNTVSFTLDTSKPDPKSGTPEPSRADVYGAFGFTIMIYFGLKASLLGGIVAVTLLVLPIMIRTMDEVMRTVPRELLDASYSLGATRLETTRILLKQSIPGILTAILLSFGRAIGDVASVMFTAGFSDNIPTSLSSPAPTLPLAIFFQLSSPIEEVQARAYASALVLTIIVLLISIGARTLSKRFSKNKI